MNLGKDLGWQAGISIVGVAVLLVLGVIAMESYTLLIQRVPESALRGPHVLFDAAVLLLALLLLDRAHATPRAADGRGAAGVVPAPAMPSPRSGTRTLVARFARSDDRRASLQVASTLIPLGLLWWLVAVGHGWAVVLAVPVMSLFLLRAFALMHDCGHRSLFRRGALNAACGFVFGVLTGMPQYVWSRHHAYHHATNGNWSKYRGPLGTLSLEEFAQMSPARQQQYRRARWVGMAPLAGLMYLVVNPRLNWLRGCAALLVHLLRGGIAQPQVGWRAQARVFRTRHWASAAEFRHMSLNNLALLGLWAAMSSLIGASLFFTIYLLATALAGAAGIVLFTVQHNFDHAYASDDQGWDHETAAIHGTSFLELPGWLNWFTADIGYHHVHHLCARIPNYRLAACHAAHAEQFAEVRRLRLSDVLPSLRCLLWDREARRIVSIDRFAR